MARPDSPSQSPATDHGRPAARRTAAWLFLVALGFYGMFIYLGASRL